ncbi:BlaI/MecI/CopY family transcriptional regulator [Pedobacter ginsengiterrae]|uniref:BlaI/MecI/CopY family transcriptional regulator n=2 Tax=Sphingobacteriaceae TaxID=84566 RepID=A0ABP7NTQ4_9SPHI
MQTINIVVTSFNQTIKIVTMIKELTKAEEQIMLILWEMEEALVKDVIEKMNEPKPAYNTVSTVIRVLEGKGFVDHKAIGNTYIYFPIIKEADYKRFALEKVMNNYFENSYESLVSFLVKDKIMSNDELNEIIQLAEKLKKDK